MTLLPEDFNYISTLVKTEAAIILDKGKEYLVQARLLPLVKAEGLESIEALVKVVKESPANGLRRKVIEALTTNETSFFRDVEPFEVLKKNVLPDLIAKRQESKKLSFWCAAASTGQEPYSLMMMLRESFPALVSWDIDFLATDISSEVLAKARNGAYSQIEINRGLPVIYLVKYFEKRGLEWHIKENIKKSVRFEELNLIKPITTIKEVDLVMIRNVLIYFDVETKRDILSRIRKVMRPDAYLFLGSAETTLNIDDNFDRRSFGKTSCYQKKSVP